VWPLWTCAFYIHIPNCVLHGSCPSSENHIASPMSWQSCSNSMHPADLALCTTPSYLTLQPSKMASTLRHHTNVLAVLTIVYTDTQHIHKQPHKVKQQVSLALGYYMTMKTAVKCRVVCLAGWTCASACLTACAHHRSLACSADLSM